MEEKKNNQQEAMEVSPQELEKKDNGQQLSEGAAEQMKGLPMRELISAPLIAACEAQQQLAAIALNYYEKIGFDDNGDTRCLEFKLERPVQVPGEITTQEVTVKVPFLGLVPVPSLLIDDINVDFQMEVKDASSSKESDNAELSSSVTGKWFSTSVNVQGKVSTAGENTRSTNQTAKYQVSESASQQKPTEGLSKLMDVMASCVEPIESGNK